MHSEITFIDGKTVNFDETADVKMTPHGVEVLQRDADAAAGGDCWRRVARHVGPSRARQCSSGVDGMGSPLINVRSKKSAVASKLRSQACSSA